MCYAREVIHAEWDRMEAGTLGEDINPWGVALFETPRRVELSSPVEEAAYDKWLDQTSSREIARQDRVHGAEGVLPTPLWIALFFISAIVLVFILGFADRGERAWVQALFMGSVVAIVVTMLLLLRFLEDPFHGDVGGLQPDAMERTEQLIDQQLASHRRRRADPVRCLGHPGVTAPGAASPAVRRDWVDVVATVVLALAAVAAAWSSYRPTRWNGEPTRTSGRVNAVRIGAARAQGLAQAQTQVDIAMFFQWINAQAAGDEELENFYLTLPPRVPPSLRRMVATDPLTDPGAPPSPFAMEQYQLEAKTEAERLDAEAAELAAMVSRNVQRAGNYVLAVVLFAVALFFAGMSTKLRTHALRKVLLVVGCIVFPGTAAWITTFPISVSV